MNAHFEEVLDGCAPPTPAHRRVALRLAAAMWRSQRADRTEHDLMVAWLQSHAVSPAAACADYRTVREASEARPSTTGSSPPGPARRWDRGQPRDRNA